MTPEFMRSCANTLATTLACAEHPKDHRLNSHLTKVEIVETIRVVMNDLRFGAEQLEGEAADKTD